jgi:hypothetical protein
LSAIIFVAWMVPTAPAILLYAVAKWLCQLTLGVHHAEQPALAGVLDARVRRELAGTRRHAGVRALADLRVDVIRTAFVVDELVDDPRRREVGQAHTIGRADPESGPP